MSRTSRNQQQLFQVDFWMCLDCQLRFSCSTEHHKVPKTLSVPWPLCYMLLGTQKNCLQSIDLLTESHLSNAILVFSTVVCRNTKRRNATHMLVQYITPDTTIAIWHTHQMAEMLYILHEHAMETWSINLQVIEKPNHLILWKKTLIPKLSNTSWWTLAYCVRYLS